jgi:RoxA-like, cytochrome c-like
LIETLGVFLAYDLTSESPAEGLFKSNAAVLDLQRVENQLARLAPPSWPEDVFGRIDREKAKKGKALFVTLCSSCHNAWPYTWSAPNKYGKRFILVGLIPQTYVGTDPQQFNTVRPYAMTAQLSKYLPGELRGKDLLPTGYLYYGASRMLVETALSNVKLSPEQEANLHGYREYPLPLPPDRVYKAAPRDGVWATPPFLHNGSVPNLYEMLIPAAERSKKFCVGREFDPIRVGVNTTCGPGTFVMETALPGNSNEGHSFQEGPRGNGVIGPPLNDEDRWALVEYLKSIPEEPGRVTPFGGPPAQRE